MLLLHKQNRRLGTGARAFKFLKTLEDNIYEKLLPTVSYYRKIVFNKKSDFARQIQYFIRCLPQIMNSLNFSLPVFGSYFSLPVFDSYFPLLFFTFFLCKMSDDEMDYGMEVEDYEEQEFADSDQDQIENGIQIISSEKVTFS